ncbi:unnamed protein product [Haemonchus placei]|uniref:SCP domain-containing protein n=1 Tax=Haemonchus placei TaxID=6290 RepID=A0A0N4W342_HAEPC|nr:unnamed protein product [Haemonchus placei]
MRDGNDNRARNHYVTNNMCECQRSKRYDDEYAMRTVWGAGLVICQVSEKQICEG